MILALQILGAALLAGGIAALAVGAAGLAWGKGRWKVYAATYRLTRALAQRAERLHHWACRLPKEPPAPYMGALYEGPIKRADIQDLTWERCTIDPTALLPSAPDAQEAAEAIADVFRRAGMTREIDDPND